jgi:Ferritin-like
MEAVMTAEPPLAIESREELGYLLGEACELEHGLMCEYLYAHFSLKRATDEGLTSEQLVRVQAWESTLVDIIKQEMLHLALATKILTAVGAAPHFERPNLPILSRWYPPEVQIAFLPFGERAMRHFMYLERPEGMTLTDAEGFVVQPVIAALAELDQPVPAVPEQWRTVGTCTGGSKPGSLACVAATARTPSLSGHRPRRPSLRPSSGRR